MEISTFVTWRGMCETPIMGALPLCFMYSCFLVFPPNNRKTFKPPVLENPPNPFKMGVGLKAMSSYRLIEARFVKGEGLKRVQIFERKSTKISR